jgi:hypothetical protein
LIRSLATGMRRKLRVILLLILTGACNNNDPPKYDSILGDWMIQTPDNETTINFLIGLDINNQFIIETATVNHNGDDFEGHLIDGGLAISPTQIESIVISSDVFVLRFIDIKVAGGFAEMEITTASLLINGAFREFSMIKATRP